jgi:hypothetical protein
MDQYYAPADVRMFGPYLCSNAKEGISSLAGLELIDACGFENNGGQGIYFENFAKLRDCTGSTYGPQGYLVRGCSPMTHRCIGAACRATAAAHPSSRTSAAKAPSS